jgi:hypothetical protein
MPIWCIETINNIKDSVVNLPVLTIKNQDFYPILDSIIELNNKCIHVAMGEATWFEIFSIADSLGFGVAANQYSIHYRIDKNSEGFFYYKNYLFVVSNDVAMGALKSAIEKSNEFRNIVTYFPSVPIYRIKECDEYYSYEQFSYLYSEYINGRFVITISWSSCIEYYPVYHKIKIGETLEKIAKIYLVKPEQIMKLNNLTDTVFPKKGVIQIQ